MLIRPDWDDVKFSIMENLVRKKFKDHPVLAKQLLATKNSILIEGNCWGDTIWGMVPDSSGVGDNWLGLILMKVRDELAK